MSIGNSNAGEMLYKDAVSQSDPGWAGSLLGGQSVLEITFYLVISVSAWVFSRGVYLLYFHPLSSFPGPYKAALSTWWLYALSKSGQSEQVLEQLHKKYSMYQLTMVPTSHLLTALLRDSCTKNRPKRASYYRSYMLPYDILAA